MHSTLVPGGPDWFGTASLVCYQEGGIEAHTELADEANVCLAGRASSQKLMNPRLMHAAMHVMVHYDMSWKKRVSLRWR